MNRRANVISLRSRNSNRNSKVLVALSGGVDSAVSAALLKKRGLEVVGVFFRFFDGVEAKKSLNKAKKVAESLGIELKVVDARKEFKKKIIDYFVFSYKKGITPNPCVVCNREMKFRLLLELLKKYKADYVATGHYARIIRQSSAGKSKSGFSLSASKSPKFLKAGLFEARDKTKDQSYFLYRLSQQELSKIIFPLGDYKKTDVKKIAKKLRLPVAEEESQDVCFLADKGINQFLRKNIEPKHGNIIDEKGKILARHRGLPFYTIGQRKGIEIGGIGPYFVIGKNTKKNQLIVSNDPKKLFTKKFEVNRVNWVDKRNWENKREGYTFPVQVQIRYHAEKIPAIIRSGKPSSAKASAGKSGKLAIETARPLRAVTPGQSAVFYKNSEVLGGGIII